MKNKKNKAFTLVELLIMLVILMIVISISFSTFTWYSKYARDALRTSDLWTLKTSLLSYYLKTSTYPEPDDSKTITYSGWVSWKQWVFWNNAFLQLWNISKLTTDPLTKNKYTYSTIENKKEYEISAVYEELLQKNKWLLNKTYAETSTKWVVKIIWTYNWIHLQVQTWWTVYTIFTPTITNWDSLHTELNKIIENNKLVIDWKNKLPTTYKDTIFTDIDVNLWLWWDLLLFEWDISDIQAKTVEWNIIRKKYFKNLQNILKWSVLEDKYSEVIKLDVDNSLNSEKIYNIVSDIINGDLK